MLLSIDFLEKRLSSSTKTIDYPFSDIKSVTKSLSLSSDTELLFPFLVDTNKKISFVFIAVSEEVRELWIEAFVNIFRRDSTGPRQSSINPVKELESS